MKKAMLIALFLLITILSFCQTIPEKIVAALDSFSFLRPQEKTYLQTDKNTYVTGETVWFKAYATLEQKPSILSGVIYAELKDVSGNLIEKKMLKLQHGTANGSIDLTEKLSSGNYNLRCYTLWMLNFPEFIFEKKIVIINNTGKSKTKPTETANITIDFFPEGGNLITGLKSRIAFKAMDLTKHPVSVSADIVDSKNNKITAIVTTHDGMGTFELQPEEGETYKAIIQFNGSQKTFSIPAAKQEGIIISADNSIATKSFIKIERGKKNEKYYNNLLVVAQINGQIAYMGNLNIDEGQDAFAINKKQLPAGIMQITVLTISGIPLAERLVFVANHSISNDLLKKEIINTSKRKKNTILLDTHDFLNFQGAVSVINPEYDITSNNTDIQSALLLTSDIKGPVFNPGYYFKDKEPETLKNLDYIMLTNGWRRFQMQDLLANKFPDLHYPFETSLSISGKVLQSDGKSVLKNGKINLIIKGEDSTSIMSQAKTNEASVFVVDKIDYKKDATIYYQGTNTSKENAIVAVKINPAYFDTLKTTSPVFTENYFTATASEAYLKNLFAQKKQSDSTSSKTLQEIIIKTKRRSPVDSLNQMYATDMFYNSDQTLIINEKIHYNDVWQYLRMMVPGISIINTDNGTEVNFTRYQGLDFFSQNGPNKGVQFFLNEIPVSLNIIESLDPADLAMIKIYKGTTGIMLGADRGAIVLYTVKGKSTRDWRQKGFDFFKKQGYSVSRDFYAVDYTKLNPESGFSDVRPTIFWNPDIKVIDGKATIEFYNDDAAKKFKLIIEGLDDNGKLLHIEKLIE